jgi:hypothetical protein
MDNASKLNFSKDGQFLTIQQRGVGLRNQVRVFSLEPERDQQIKHMTRRELRSLACQTAEFGGSSKLTPLEALGWLADWQDQPCD